MREAMLSGGDATGREAHVPGSPPLYQLAPRRVAWNIDHDHLETFGAVTHGTGAICAGRKVEEADDSLGVTRGR